MQGKPCGNDPSTTNGALQHIYARNQINGNRRGHNARPIAQAQRDVPLPNGPPVKVCDSVLSNARTCRVCRDHNRFPNELDTPRPCFAVEAPNSRTQAGDLNRSDIYEVSPLTPIEVVL
jgi:hypothetical protein